MRTLFLALLSANLLFLAWARWIDAPRDASPRNALSRLPRLQLVTEVPPAPKQTETTVQKMSLHQSAVPLSRSCTTVGPFNDMASAARTAGILLEHGFNPRDRAEKGETLEGYWVYVGGMQSDEDVARVVQRLEKSGFTDAHVMKTSPDGRRVSVGLFSKRERAERRALAVRHMGLDPQIGERRFPGTVYWVDVGVRSEGPHLPAEALTADAGGPKIGVDACPPGVRLAAPDQQSASSSPGARSDEGGRVVRALPRTTVASAPKRP